MKHSNQWLQKRWSIWQIVYYYITQLKKTKQKEQNDTLTTQPHKKKSNKSSWSVRMLWSHNITEKAHQSCWSIFCICCWFCIFSRFTREHDLATSPTKGITGRLSQLHISIMNPSGSWKNSWSTWIPPSSTVART